MIQNKITMLPISDIKIDWKSRRSTDPEHIKNLAESIATTGLIHTIVVDSNGGNLCAGGHRIRAFKLNAANNVPCSIRAYQDWTVIPARFATNFSESELARIELIENLQHRHLTWTEEVLGVKKLHDLQTDQDTSWVKEQTADLVGLHRSTIDRIMLVAPHITAQDATILSCDSLGSAFQIIQRQNQRKKAAIIEDIVTGGPAAISTGQILGTEKRKEQPAAEPAPEPASPILCESFHTFAATYSGPRFNFLHCDFPYGINISKGDGQGGIKDINKYDDSPEIYWKLLHTLAEHQDTLLASSCHILFWFSQNFRRETEEFFAHHMPNFKLQKFLLIWHFSDSSGLCPDPNRYGRRNYETAFVLSAGDRKIVKVKNLSFPHPGKNSNRLHRSEKPLSVVEYFMSMFVDEHSIVLDPTCGSGTSIRAAQTLKAQKFVGLEIDNEMQQAATKEFFAHN